MENGSERLWLKKTEQRRMVVCLFFLLLQILLRGLDLGRGHHLGLLQVCPHPRQVLRKEPFSPPDRASQASPNRKDYCWGGGGQAGRALHGASLTGLLVDRVASRVDRTLLHPLQHRLRGHGKEQSPQHQGDGAPEQCKGTN